MGVALTGLFTLLPLPAVAELSSAIQADLYLVQTDDYMQKKDYAAAREAMGKILELQKEHDLTLPPVFHFKYATVLDRAEAYDEAIAQLHQYLELAGQSGKHYREALTLLHRVTEAAAEKRATEEEATRKAAARRAAAAEAQRKAAAAREVAKSIEMVVVPAGSFMMGSEPQEADYEGPVHRVTIRQPFAVGKYEVTFAEWDACVDAGGCGGYRPNDRGWGRGRRPVIAVNWQDAQRFVEWLSKETGGEYRLLSEAEWEYVARAGTTTPFHTGGTISTAQANYDGNYTYGGGRTGTYRERTVPVGSFPPNRFGLHDVHGNVWEW